MPINFTPFAIYLQYVWHYWWLLWVPAQDWWTGQSVWDSLESKTSRSVPGFQKQSIGVGCKGYDVDSLRLRSRAIHSHPLCTDNKLSISTKQQLNTNIDKEFYKCRKWISCIKKVVVTMPTLEHCLNWPGIQRCCNILFCENFVRLCIL